MSIATAWYAFSVNQSYGFPLDDGWIHLQFAKNLHEYGSFSYYKNTMVTAGSTAPLYTFILAVGFFFTSNEMILSYFLGISFFLVGIFFFYRLLTYLYEPGSIIPFVGACLLALEPRLHWVALSGMETTLFISLTIAALYFYQSRAPFSLGIILGLLVWTRPEAFMLPPILLADWRYGEWIKNKQSKNKKRLQSRESFLRHSWMAKGLALWVLFVAGYLFFNFWLSGSLLPNTYSAKLKYYSNGGERFPSEVFQFLTNGHMTALAVFAGIFLLSVATTSFQRKPQTMFVPLVWSAALFMAYWKNLPFLYQNGRYMMPLLPMVILMGLQGMAIVVRSARRISNFLQKKKNIVIVQGAIGFLMVLQFGYASWQGRTVYQDYCKYITDRQVTTARWIAKNLPLDAVVATHDVGAIAFYSGRKIVDMVGLISPEMVPRIGRLDLLMQFLVAQKTTHLVVLRNWFEIANQKLLYRTDERTPEIMEVFEFTPSTIHFVLKNAGNLNGTAADFLRHGQLQEAGAYLQQSLRIDPENATSYIMLGEILFRLGKYDQAEAAFHSALQYYSTSAQAAVWLARTLERQGKYDDAIAVLESLASGNTDDPQVYRLLADITRAYSDDTRRAEMYEQRYNNLMRSK